jgi:hypothetical protein
VRARSGLGDRSLAALEVGGPLGGDDSEESRDHRSLWEAVEVADLGAQSGGSECVDPAEAPQPGDHRRVRALRYLLLEHLEQRRAATGDSSTDAR